MDKEFIKNNFFVISRDNLDSVASRFHGMVIDGRQIRIGSLPEPRLLKNDCPGEYVNIVRSGDDILVQQDYHGLFGLYLWQRDGDFALSNSFFYLLSYLRGKGARLTFNYDYARAILYTGTSLFFDRTIIDEIEFVPHFYTLKISVAARSLEKVRKPLKKASLMLGSAQGMAALDAWHNKWHSIATAVTRAGQQLIVNISGGKDSRASLSVAFGCERSGMNHDDIHFYSIADSPRKREDYEIAGEIGQKLGFALNAHPSKSETGFLTSFMSLAISFLGKAHFHNELAYKKLFFLSPQFIMGGNGGEYLREYWTEEPDQFIMSLVRSAPPKLASVTAAMLEQSMADIAREYACSGLVRGLYECCRCRNHFGRYGQEKYLVNQIDLMPLLDPAMQEFVLSEKGRGDRDLLFAVIYDRYLRAIDDVRMDSGKFIAAAIKERAREINAAFPPQEEGCGDVFEIDYCRRQNPSTAQESPDTDKLIEELFFSDEFRKVVVNICGQGIYDRARCQFRIGDLSIAHHVNSLVVSYVCLMASSPALAKRNGRQWITQLLDIYRFANEDA